MTKTCLSWLIPVLALASFVAVLVTSVGTWLTVLCAAVLMGTVITAVHHAEVVAHRVGEPFGTLVLAVAVTVIETALILSMVIAGGNDMAVLARDSIHAAVMIICTGVVGLCVLLGGIAHREQTFRVEGAGAGLAALIVMSTLTLVLPGFTTTTPGGTYSSSQLAFVAVSSAALWAIFIFVQTVRHVCRRAAPAAGHRRDFHRAGLFAFRPHSEACGGSCGGRDWQGRDRGRAGGAAGGRGAVGASL
jgi:Ca2+:H+ antiporter